MRGRHQLQPLPPQKALEVIQTIYAERTDFPCQTYKPGTFDLELAANGMNVDFLEAVQDEDKYNARFSAYTARLCQQHVETCHVAVSARANGATPPAAPVLCATPTVAADVTAVCVPACQVAGEPTDRRLRGHRRPECRVLRRLPLTLLPRVVVPKSQAETVPVLLSTCARGQALLRCGALSTRFSTLVVGVYGVEVHRSNVCSECRYCELIVKALVGEPSCYATLLSLFRFSLAKVCDLFAIRTY